MDRDEITRFVYQRLLDRGFRDHLTAVGDDGGHPVIVALREDPMSRVIDHVEAAGGAGNVVVPFRNGLMVFCFTNAREVSDDEPLTDDHCQDVLTSDCTVGVFVARLHIESASVYRFTRGAGQPEGMGRAELVAVAG